MTPDVAAILLAGALSVAAWTLWSAGRLRGVAGLLALVAVVAVIASVVLHDVEVGKVVSGLHLDDPEWNFSDPDAGSPPGSAS
jgi:hypothetical protein